mmetsp:Transcript_16178/g.14107  ORF Transcript_16178/g.14107 Transcript_16178/m.14107 type:complete len:241 (+) Transcript_16178:176-898(+)
MENHRSFHENPTQEIKEMLGYLPIVLGIYEFGKDDKHLNPYTKSEKLQKNITGVLVMKYMLKGFVQPNYIDIKLGFRPSNRPKYAKNPKKYDKVAFGTTLAEHGFLLLGYGVKHQETGDIITKGFKDFRLENGEKDFSKALTFEQSQERLEQFVYDFNNEEACQYFTTRIQQILGHFEERNTISYRTLSIFAANDKENNYMTNLVDLAYVYPDGSEDKEKEGIIVGLKNLKKIFESALSK